MTIEESITKELETIQKKDAQKWFQQLVQKSEYVGELFSIDYENAKIQIHDNERQKVGGIPSLSFLIATRIDPEMQTLTSKRRTLHLFYFASWMPHNYLIIQKQKE